MLHVLIVFLNVFNLECLKYFHRRFTYLQCLQFFIVCSILFLCFQKMYKPLLTLLVFLTQTESHFYDDLDGSTVYTEDLKKYLPHTSDPLITLNPSKLCDIPDDDDDGPPFLLILIHSHLVNKPRRDAIRNTWIRDIKRQHQPITLLFVVAMTTDSYDNDRLIQEAHLYQDILQFNFTDLYKNLVLKSVLSLRWASVHCGNAKFLFKTDDDMFINGKMLLNILETSANRSMLMGSVYEHSDVHRSGIWAVDSIKYPSDHFPDYCSGTGYVMSMDVAKQLSNYRPLTQIIHIEDAYITGLLALNLSIPCKHHEQFPNWMTVPRISNVELFYQNKLLGVHGLTFDRMYQIWNRTLYEDLIPNTILTSN